jgi:hypothetical protein
MDTNGAASYRSERTDTMQRNLQLTPEDQRLAVIALFKRAGEVVRDRRDLYDVGSWSPLVSDLRRILGRGLTPKEWADAVVSGIEVAELDLRTEHPLH